MARYTIDFGKRFEILLEKLAEDRGVTKSEILRRAVASYDYLIRNADDASGRKVSITDAADKVLKDVVLP